jgi:hypothetical protein
MPVKPIKNFTQSLAFVLFQLSRLFYVVGNGEDTSRHSSLIVNVVRHKSNKHKTLALQHLTAALATP